MCGYKVVSTTCIPVLVETEARFCFASHNEWIHRQFATARTHVDTVLLEPQPPVEVHVEADSHQPLEEQEELDRQAPLRTQ